MGAKQIATFPGGRIIDVEKARLYECFQCAFTFDAGHRDDRPGDEQWTCPVCTHVSTEEYVTEAERQMPAGAPQPRSA